LTSLAQLERGVVGYWCPMLQTTGLRLYDRSGRGNHGTLTNMDAASDWVTASVRNRSGRVLDFDGSNDLVDIGNVSIANFGTRPFTVSLWLRAAPFSANSAIFSKDDWDLGTTGLLIYSAVPTAPGFQNRIWYWSSGTTANQFGAIADSTWHHIAVSRQSTAANATQMFLDGRSIVTTTDSTNYSNSRRLRIANDDDGNRNFPGQIGEAAIWNRALTASEIQTLDRLGPGWLCKPPPTRKIYVPNQLQTVLLNRLESTAQTFNPTVVLNTASVISLNRLESTAQIFLPTIVQAGGVQTVTLDLLSSTAQIFLPTINLVGAVTDTSDILDRYRKRRSESKEEEQVAAQLLKARQKRPELQKKRKELTDWKKLIYKAIYGAESEEELNAINTTDIPTNSPEAITAILAEIKEKKAARRLELKLKMEEAALQSAQLENQITAKIEEQKKIVEATRKLQQDVLVRYELAVKAAQQVEMLAFLELQATEQKAAEFTRKRNNRIKRLKALMWLAKLDL